MNGWELAPDIRKDRVHNVAFGAAPGLVDMQNHQGVHRSRDGGQVWEEINEGLPYNFCHPVFAKPRDSGTLWVFPLNGDGPGRYPVNGRALIWKSTDESETCAEIARHLPTVRSVEVRQ